MQKIKGALKDKKIKGSFCNSVMFKGEFLEILLENGVKNKDAERISEKISDKIKRKFSNIDLSCFLRKGDIEEKGRYLADGIQYSLFDLLVDKKAEFWQEKAGARKEKGLRVLDLFAGIGGVKMGFEKAGFECIFSNDIDKGCKETYDFNFAEKQKGMIKDNILKFCNY